MKLFIVTWSTASVDDRNNVQSFNGIDGIFKDRASAEQALETSKQGFIEELRDYCEEEPSESELFEEFEVSISGSPADGYYDLSYFLADTPLSAYLQIIETDHI